MASIPLANRVPNLRAVRVAPDVVAAIEAAHEQEPTLFVVGEPPSALHATFAAVHARGAAQLASAIVVDAAQSPSPLGALLRAIVRARELDAPDWAETLRTEVHELVELVIDAADAPGFWMVVHVGERWNDDLAELAHAATRYARLARWTFVGREVPAPATGESPPSAIEVDPASVSVLPRAPSLPPRAVSSARGGASADAIAPTVPGTTFAPVPTTKRGAGATSEDAPALESVGPAARLTELDDLLAAGDPARVNAWAERHLESLFEEGYAPELAVRLTRSASPELWALAARACVLAHDFGRIEALGLPDEPCSPETHFAIAERELFLGHVHSALAYARKAADAATNVATRRRALALAGHMANIGAPPEEARAIFERLESSMEGSTLQERAVVAMLRALGGDAPAALRIAVPIADELRASQSAPDARTLDALLYSFIFSDRIDLGLDAYERWVEGARRVMTPEFLYSGAFLLQQNGQLARSNVLIDRLAKYARGRNSWARGVRYLRARAAFAAGNLAGLDASVATLEAEAIEAKDPIHYVLARNVRMRLDLAHGRPMGSAPWPEGLRPPTQRHQRALRIEAEPAGAPEPTDRNAIVRTIASGLAAAAGGDLGAAWAALDHADVRFRTGGIEIDRAELANMRALLALATGDAARLPQSLTVLAEASRWPSAMHAREVTLFTSLAFATPDLAALERMCGAALESPRAFRLAHLLLGGAPPSDFDGCLTGPLERITVRAMWGRWGGVVRTVSGDTSTPGWGFDAKRLLVWRHDGEEVALASAPTLVALLRALFDSPRGVTKEELAARVWQLPDFHPLRDSKRMQVAVRKLRSLVERDPGNPTRVVTREDGYALGAAEAARVFVPV